MTLNFYIAYDIGIINNYVYAVCINVMEVIVCLKMFMLRLCVNRLLLHVQMSH